MSWTLENFEPQMDKICLLKIYFRYTHRPLDSECIAILYKFGGYWIWYVMYHATISLKNIRILISHFLIWLLMKVLKVKTFPAGTSCCDLRDHMHSFTTTAACNIKDIDFRMHWQSRMKKVFKAMQTKYLHSHTNKILLLNPYTGFLLLFTFPLHHVRLF